MKRLGLILLVLPVFSFAEVVVPLDSVENHVNIRLSPDAGSEIVGRLNQGEWLTLVGSIPGWHEVEITGGATGFVSADWSTVLDEAPVTPADEVAASTEPAPVADEAAVDAEPVATVEAPAEDPAPPEAQAGATIDTLDPAGESVAASDDEQPAEPTPGETFDDAVADSEAGDDAPVEAAAPVEPVAPVTDTADDTTDVPMADDVASDDSGDAVSPAITGTAVVPGPQGPPGPSGPPGAPGKATVEGSVDFLVKFTAPTIGGNSQVYDDGNNIGIGTTEPKQRLEVNGNIQIHERNSSVAGLMITQSDGETGYIMHNRASTLTIGAGSVDRITVDRNGNVGLGVSRPTNPLELANGAHVTTGGVWTNSSSRERKENITDLPADEAIAALAQLEPVRFNYRNDRTEDYVGFIAEDVPALVATNDRDGLSAMDIVAVLTRVVQEQQLRIEELEARLDQR